MMPRHNVNRWTKMRALLRREGGASAVEFALFAPILFFALVATADLALGLYQRTTLDHVLRAGAQRAMVDAGEQAVCQVLQLTAAKHFAVSGSCGSAGADGLVLSSQRYFSCPENPTVPVASSTYCAGNLAPGIYYRLSAAMPFEGAFLPISIGPYSIGALTLNSSAQVRTR